MASRFDRDPSVSGPVVQGFAGKGFRVDGNVYEGVLLTPLSAAAWRAPPLAELAIADFEAVLSIEPIPEFLLLGTGANFAFAPPALARALGERGIGIEAMDSKAAARTWGLLRGEGRWIAAALMPLG